MKPAEIDAQQLMGLEAYLRKEIAVLETAPLSVDGLEQFRRKYYNDGRQDALNAVLRRLESCLGK